MFREGLVWERVRLARRVRRYQLTLRQVVALFYNSLNIPPPYHETARIGVENESRASCIKSVLFIEIP